MNFAGLTANLLGFGMLLGTPAVCIAQPDVHTSEEVHSEQAWPRFLGPRFNGSAIAVGEFDFTKPPSLVWTISLGDGYGIGSIADGRFYQMDAGDGDTPLGVVVPEKIERLRCFDFETGRLHWSQTQKIVYRDLLGYEDGPAPVPPSLETESTRWALPACWFVAAPKMATRSGKSILNRNMAWFKTFLVSRQHPW